MTVSGAAPAVHRIPCPDCRHGGHEVYGEWIVCKTCEGWMVVAVDRCPTCGQNTNPRPVSSAPHKARATEEGTG